MSKLIKITDKELLAIKAVAYGCNKNSRLIISTFVTSIGTEEEKKIGFGEALNVVSDLIEKVENDKHSGWIPCKEDLPKKAGFYLVTKKLHKGMKPLVCKEYFEPSKGWADLGNGATVLAWMPKIEPWKGAFDE